MSQPQHLSAGHKPLANDEALIARTRFPLLRDQPELVYLDSAASAQKPDVVIDRLARFYRDEYANIHRGLYPLSETATEAYDAARARVARFLGAETSEIVFTHSATEGINLVAHTFGDSNLQPGDLILTTLLEHHANIVPWQLLKQRRQLRLAAIPVDAAGDLDLAQFERQLSGEPKLVCVTAAANTIGTVTPLKKIISLAHRFGALVMVDAAQAAAHLKLDVKELDCDFLVVTGHKLYGPDGIGALYIKEELMANLPPFMGGGGIIRSVSIDQTEYIDGPRRFEAGTPAIGAALALEVALDFIEKIGFDAITAHDTTLTHYAIRRLSEIPSVQILGNPQHRIGIVSFVVDGVHPHDIGTLLGQNGVCLRTGHHCAQPLMAHFGVTGTARLSFGVYNTVQDIDRLIDSLVRVRQMLR